MNIEATVDLIMSAIKSDAFDREACVKILRDAQEREELDTSCSHPFPQLGCPDCGAWLPQPKPESSWQNWTVRRLDELLNLKFELGPVKLSVPEYLSRLDHLVAEIRDSIERSHAAQCTCDNANGLHWGRCPLNMKTAQPKPQWACSRWGGYEHDWLACPDCLKAYDIQNEAQLSDRPPSSAKTTDDKQEWTAREHPTGYAIYEGERMLLTSLAFTEACSLSYAHNAALADDDKKRFFAFWRENGQLKQELAAECEKSRILGNMTDGFREQIKQHQVEYDRLSGIIEKDTLRIVELKQQLAAVNNELTRWRGLYQERDDQLAAERQRREQIEGDYQKIVTEILKCNPIPAKDRPDDQLEPPWEVITRIHQQLLSAQAAIETIKDLLNQDFEVEAGSALVDVRYIEQAKRAAYGIALAKVKEGK